MTFSKLAMIGLVLASTHAMAFQLNCVRDERPVDGDSVEFTLTFNDNNGVALATFQEDGGGRTVEHHETTKLLAMSCKKESGVFLNITCSGPGQTLVVSDIEVAGGPGPGVPFAHVINVETNYDNKKFSFGGLQQEHIRNSCSWQ